MTNKVGCDTLLIELLSQIEDFYFASLKKAPETCLEEAERVINALENIEGFLENEEKKTLQIILQKAHNAWQETDFVLARDYFYFEMKPYIEKKLKNFQKSLRKNLF